MYSTSSNSSMLNFTSDFFGALETTPTNSSINKSICESSVSNINKSMFIKQIKEEGLLKMEQIIVKLCKFYSFQAIYRFASKSYWDSLRTPLNLHKSGYKIELLFKLKSRAKLQWGFHKLTKYSEDSSHETQGKVCQIQAEGKASKMGEVLQKILVKSRLLRAGFTHLQQYEHYLNKKSYLFQLLTYFSSKNLRAVFLHLLIYKKDSEVLIDQQGRRIGQENPFRYPKKEQASQSNIKFKKCVKSSQQIDQINTLDTPNNENRLSRPVSGLKFNKCFKRKTQTNEKKEQNEKMFRRASALTSPKKFQSGNDLVTASKPVRILNIQKSIRMGEKVEKSFYRQNQFKDFHTLKLSYHLPISQFKQQIPDVVSKVIERQEIGIGFFKEVEITSTKHIHSIQKKLTPLQFTGKRLKSKSRSKKALSKKSRKSKDSQSSDREKEINMTEMGKLQYFPNDPSNWKESKGTNQRPGSTKFIGSSKWNGQQKKRVSTNILIKTGKSSEKSPYFQEIQQRITKKSNDKVINLHTVIEKNLAIRSNSKNPKERNKVEIQYNHDQRNNGMVVSPNQRQQTTKVSPLVPKQWTFSNMSPVQICLPVKIQAKSPYKKDKSPFK